MRRLLRPFLLLSVLVLAACGGTPPVKSDSGPTPQSTSVAPPVIDVSVSTDPVTAAAGANAHRIAVATALFVRDHLAPESTRGLFDAPMREECAAAVQAVLQAAKLPFIGHVDANGKPPISVDGARAALVADTAHWQRLDPNDEAYVMPLPGDIWIQGDGHPGDQAGQNHMGICQDRGCTRVVSTSSQRGSFTWSSTPDDYAAYFESLGFPYLPGAIYHRR